MLSTEAPQVDTELNAIQENFLHYMCDYCQFPIYKHTGVANLLCGTIGGEHTPNSIKPECVLCAEIAKTGCPSCGATLI